MDNNDKTEKKEANKFPYRFITNYLPDALEYGNPEEKDKSSKFLLNRDTIEAGKWDKGR